MSPAEWFILSLGLALLLGAYFLGRADGKHKSQVDASECRADELMQAADRHDRIAVEWEGHGRDASGWRNSASDLRMHATLIALGRRK